MTADLLQNVSTQRYSLIAIQMSQKWQNHRKTTTTRPTMQLPGAYWDRNPTHWLRWSQDSLGGHGYWCNSNLRNFLGLNLGIFSYGVIFQRIKHNDFFVGDNFGRFHPKVCYLKVPGEKQGTFWHCATMRNNFPKKKYSIFMRIACSPTWRSRDIIEGALSIQASFIEDLVLWERIREAHFRPGHVSLVA